ncbi:MAG: N-acetyltransferase [Pseudolabrys sp.]|nr:N-acetyltransferase [Pseudolabrys sp.]
MTLSLQLTIRPERPDEAAAIRTVLDAAFGGPAEGELVDSLRAAGDLVLALVAVDNDAIAGYIAWPRLLIETPRDVRNAVALAPLGVAPSHQRNGIGSALTRAGLAQLKENGERLVFVVGDPLFYQRFGFSLEAARAYVSDYAGEYFMALRLADDPPEQGLVRYPTPFDGLS